MRQQKYVSARGKWLVAGVIALGLIGALAEIKYRPRSPQPSGPATSRPAPQ